MLAFLMLTMFAHESARANVPAPPVYRDDPNFVATCAFVVALLVAFVLGGIWLTKCKWFVTKVLAFVFTIATVVLAFLTMQLLHFSERPPDAPRPFSFDFTVDATPSESDEDDDPLPQTRN